MRPPTKSIFRSHQWVDRDQCAFGGPGCHEKPEPGHRFCEEHTTLFARIRRELGNTSFVHETTFKKAA